MRIRAALSFSISAVVALAGCQFGRHPTDPGSTQIARIVVSPATVTTASMVASGQIRKRRVVQVLVTPANASMPAGASQQFSASGRRNTGDTVPLAVSFAAT